MRDYKRSSYGVRAALAIALAAPLMRADSGSAAAAAPSRAELPEMVTDRPDFTESAEVVGRGVLQIETGVTLDRTAGTRQISEPEPLLRLGVSRRVELRFGGDGLLAVVSDRGSVARGHSDADFGAKIKLWSERGWLPAVAAIPAMGMPFGSRHFSSGGYDPSLKMAWAKELPREFSLSGNVNFASLRAEEGRYFQNVQSFSVARGLTEGLGAYWEVFRVSSPGEASAWIANSGVTRAVGPNAQFDVRAGRRLTAAGPDWFFGAGFVFRQGRLF